MNQHILQNQLSSGSTRNIKNPGRAPKLPVPAYWLQHKRKTNNADFISLTKLPFQLYKV